jgi:hypothetical protein
VILIELSENTREKAWPMIGSVPNISSPTGGEPSSVADNTRHQSVFLGAVQNYFNGQALLARLQDAPPSGRTLPEPFGMIQFGTYL